MALEIGAGITFGGGITITIPSGGGGASSYAPQYTSDPGGDPWPTTADYSYVSYHDFFGLTVKGMKSSSALYTFFSTAGTGDSFKVTFSGTVYTFTLGDYNSGTAVIEESNGITSFYKVELSSVVASVSPSLSAGEGTTLYGTLISDLTEAGGGGSTPIVEGSAQILDNTFGSQGASVGNIGGFGTLTATPSIVQFLQYNTNFSKTFVMFIIGSSTGVNITETDVDGHTTVSMTLNGVTASSEGTPTNMGGTYLRFEWTGDPFGIVSSVGSMKLFSITLV